MRHVFQRCHTETFSFCLRSPDRQGEKIRLRVPGVSFYVAPPFIREVRVWLWLQLSTGLKYVLKPHGRSKNGLLATLVLPQWDFSNSDAQSATSKHWEVNIDGIKLQQSNQFWFSCVLCSAISSKCRHDCWFSNALCAKHADNKEILLIHKHLNLFHSSTKQISMFVTTLNVFHYAVCRLVVKQFLYNHYH